MPQLVSCRCGQQFKAAPHLTGKQVACPVCGQTLQIPRAMKPAQRIEVACGGCGSRYTTTSENIGKQLPCSNGGQHIMIREAAAAPDPLDYQPASAPIKPYLNATATRRGGSTAARAQSRLSLEASHFLDTMEENKPMLEKVGATILMIGILFGLFGMVPGWKLLPLDWPPLAFYLTAMSCGAIGGFMIGNRYCIPGMIGYAVGAMAALFAVTLPLHYVERIYTPFLFALCLIGLVPGALIDRGLMRVQDAMLSD